MGGEFERLGREYRHIDGWETTRPPMSGYIVKARVGDAAPDYDPMRISRPIIVDPGTEFARMFDPTKGQFVPLQSRDTKAATATIAGPSLFGALGSAPTNNTPAPRTQPVNKTQVELEIRGSPFTTTTAYHHILYVGDSDKPTHIVLVWDISDKTDRVHIRGRLNTVMAVHVVGSARVFACDISTPVVFTFENYEFCILPVVGEGVYAAD